jgi:sugar lactone lactonase YvrE
MIIAGCGTDTEATPEEAAEGAPEVVDLASMEPIGLENPYMTHPNWGILPQGRTWGRVSGVGVDPAGETIWVFERCGGDNCIESDDPAVLHFSPHGELLGSFGADMFVRPHGMYVDGEGNVWVTDGRAARPEELAAAPDAANKGNQVVKFSPEGQILMVIGTPGVTGDPPAALNQPNDVIVAPNGEILISEGHSAEGPHGRISRFAADGTFIGTIGEFGSGPGQFATPHAMAFDSQGRLFVADRGNSRIQIFDQDYNFVAEWRQFGRPNDVFIDDDDTMFVLDSESGTEENPGMRRGIYIGSAQTGELTAFVPGHQTDNPLGTIGEGVTVDAAGNVFVGEVSINGMTMFMPMMGGGM